MKGKRLIIACIAVIATLLIAAASVLATNAVVESKTVGVDKALAAAIEANELDPAAVEEASVKLRIRDGVAVYVVKLEAENVKYFVTVNAQTCEIIESAKNECIRPEKPEKPDDTEKPDGTEKPSEGEEIPEKPERPDENKENGKGRDKGPKKGQDSGHKKGQDKIPPKKGPCDKNKKPASPDKSPAPETTA